jgi:hypothetical protein
VLCASHLTLWQGICSRWLELRFADMQSIFWDKVAYTGNAPSSRSGHSFTKVGSRYLLFGGAGCTQGTAYWMKFFLHALAA